MTVHTHEFVETYQGLAAFGLDRATDEDTVIYMLQKFTDDQLMKVLVKRMSDEELEEAYSYVTRLLKTHLSDHEYHELFLKEAHP